MFPLLIAPVLTCQRIQSPPGYAAAGHRPLYCSKRALLPPLLLQAWALGAARYGAALVVLGSGLLSGRRAITSALMAALLWLGMVLGELRIMSQVCTGIRKGRMRTPVGRQNTTACAPGLGQRCTVSAAADKATSRALHAQSSSPSAGHVPSFIQHLQPSRL